MNRLFSLSRILASRLSNSFPTPTLDIDHSRSWSSHPSFAEKIYGFLSVPAAGKRFIFNTSNTLFRKSLEQIRSELKLAFDHQWGGSLQTKNNCCVDYYWKWHEEIVKLLTWLDQFSHFNFFVPRCEWSRKCSHIASYILLPKFDAQYQILQTCSCHLTRMQNSKQHKDSQFTMKNPERVLDGLITGSFIIGVDMLRLPENDNQISRSIHLWGTAFPASIHALSEYQKNFHTRNYV
ncbi:hypothetical protein Csa_013348 [Cucumis sativus]|uniref:Uncharacterized protein n=1 Tax=Cucumis sativus TaxID=3659 RepID=A0A0A0LVM8_CUCSA|nr:hypothetical protein Csa_013348 [Cucumis sativus]